MIEIGLVGTTTALGHAQETVFHAFGGLEVDLGRKVATGVHLVKHSERCILRVAQVLLGIGLENAQRESLLVAESCPHLLSLLAMDDSRTSVLAQRQLALHRSLGIAQEGESNILVVLARFGVVQDFSYLLVVSTAQHERHIAEACVGKLSESLGLYFQDWFAFKVAHAHVVLGKKVVLGFVFPKLEHGGILKLWSVSHNKKRLYYLFNYFNNAKVIYF